MATPSTTRKTRPSKAAQTRALREAAAGNPPATPAEPPAVDLAAGMAVRFTADLGGRRLSVVGTLVALNPEEGVCFIHYRGKEHQNVPVASVVPVKVKDDSEEARAERLAKITNNVAKPARVPRGERPIVKRDPIPLTFDPLTRYPDIAPTHVPAIEKAYAGDDRAAILRALAAAYEAGLPITVMGKLIGRSAADARRLAIAGAKLDGLELTFRGRGNAVKRADGGGSAATITYDPETRYSGWKKQAAKIDKAADRDAAILDAMVAGFPITLIGFHLKVSASSVHQAGKRAADRLGRPFPSKDERKQARSK